MIGLINVVIVMTYSVELTIINVLDIPVADVMSSDPYVKIRVGNEKFKTKVVKNTLFAQYDEKFKFKIQDG